MFSSAAEQLAGRAGGFANEMATKTARVAQHVNEIAGDVASANAKIQGSYGNLAGGRESLVYVAQVGAEKLNYVNELTSDLSTTNARIQANGQRLGGHESFVHITNMLKTRLSRRIVKNAGTRK
jgi:hypothetical protein